MEAELISSRVACDWYSTCDSVGTSFERCANEIYAETKELVCRAGKDVSFKCTITMIKPSR